MASENAAQSIKKACEREGWIPDGMLRRACIACE